MIIKGRSPTMRHVSRTHRVALDWLFDRINLDSKNQLADMVTQGSFTRDAWYHLPRLLNIMNFSMFSRSHFFLLKKAKCHEKEGKKVSSGILPVTYCFIGDPPEDPIKPARAEHGTGKFWRSDHGTGKFWRSDHLHVDVQRHRLDKRRKR